MITKYTVLLLMLLAPLCTNAFAYEGSPQEQVRSFFKDLSAGRSNDAIDNLYGSSGICVHEP